MDSEQEQLEALRKWWRDNGTALIIGLAIGLAILFGWRYWVDGRNQRAEQASITYELMLAALQKNDMQTAIDIGERIMTSYEDSSYSVLSALLLGRVAMERQNLADARAKLQWARDHADSTGLKHIASARIARVLLFEGQHDAATAELAASGVADVDDFHELKGDIRAASGDVDGARSMYEQAIAKLTADGLDARYLELKRDNLAPASSAPAETTADATP